MVSRRGANPEDREDSAQVDDRLTSPAGVPRLRLSPSAGSAGQARRWVADRLEGRADDEVIETAVLVVSEIVTNAVLHAGTDIHVGAEVGDGVVRVEVADRNEAVPVAKNYPRDSATGRGLHLVSALTQRWGVEAGPAGKVVWAEVVPVAADTPLSLVPDLSAWPELDDAGGASDAADDALVEVALLGIPLPLLSRCSEQYDAVTREFRLLVERDPDAAHAVPARLLALADEISERYSAFTAGTNLELRAAIDRGEPEMDLTFRVPRSVGAAAAHYDGLLDEADAYCREGRELLTLAPDAEAAAVRRWVLHEFTGQAGGGPAVKWEDSPWAHDLAGGA